jgi:hypothetical protein
MHFTLDISPPRRSASDAAAFMEEAGIDSAVTSISTASVPIA